MSTDRKLEKLQDAIKKAQDELRAYLQQKFPKDSEVAVLLKHGQTNPSYGIVVGHFHNGYVSVELNNAKERSRLRVRSIHPNSIVWVGGAV